MPQAKKSSRARLDAMAKAKGFPSYAAFAAWNEKYRQPVTNNAAPSKIKNVFQKIGDVIPIRYASRKVTETLNKVNRK